MLGGAIGSTTVDSASDFVGAVFSAPETGTVTNLHFRVGTITSSQQLRGGLYTVDAATGGPGTLVGAAGTVTPGVADTVYSLTGMSASVTKGQKYCVKIDFSGTVGNIAFTTSVLTAQMNATAVFPYQVVSTDNAGTLSKKTNGLLTPVSIEYSGGVFHHITGLSPVCNSENKALSSSGTIAGGIRFQVPVPVTVSGLWAGATFANGSACTLDLYDDSTAPGGTPLATSAVDEDALSSNSNGVGLFLFDDGAEVTLLPGVWYRAVIRATATTNITFYRGIGLPSSEHMKQMYGTNLVYSTSYASGAWTDSDTTISCVGLIVSKFHDATGIGAASMNLGI